MKTFILILSLAAVSFLCYKQKVKTPSANKPSSQFKFKESSNIPPFQVKWFNATLNAGCENKLLTKRTGC